MRKKLKINENIMNDNREGFASNSVDNRKISLK